MNDVTYTILLMGAVVFCVRSIAFIFADRIFLPAAVKDGLELMLPAILTVLVASGIFEHETSGTIYQKILNPYLLAALATFILAIKIKSFFGVVFFGYLSFLFFNFMLKLI